MYWQDVEALEQRRTKVAAAHQDRGWQRRLISKKVGFCPAFFVVRRRRGDTVERAGGTKASTHRLPTHLA
jgi:hypothetical protein